MVSPELLRRYPFFGPFDSKDLKEIAMMSDEIDAEKGAVLFEIDAATDQFFLLITGGVDLYDISIDEHDPSLRKEFFVGEVDPGEMLAISAMVEPYKATVQGRVSTDSHLVKIDALRLREYAVENPGFGYKLMHQVAKLTLSRLAETRVMLAGVSA